MTNTLTVLTNSGGGTFVTTASPTADRTSTSIVSADVNGDERLDLICANYGSWTITVLTNAGNAGFLTASTVPVAANPLSVVAADINGDGQRDLVCSSYSDNALTLILHEPLVLSIQSVDSNSVKLTWPSWTGATPQWTSDLAATNWSELVPDLGDDGTNKSTLLSPAIGNQFYRLFQP
jgi:hypothetical protein